MKRTAIASAIAVTVLSGSLIAGSASAASAANGAKSGGAEGVVTIIGSAIDIVGALNGPAVNTDLTVKNDTGYPIEIVGMSPRTRCRSLGQPVGRSSPLVKPSNSACRWNGNPEAGSTRTQVSPSFIDRSRVGPVRDSAAPTTRTSRSTARSKDSLSRQSTTQTSGQG